LSFLLQSVGPTAPDSIIVDTIPVPAVASIHVIPEAVELLVGESVQMCAILEFTDGMTALGIPEGGWTDADALAYCENEYQQWLTQRTL
jgi:hypothetical protein